MKNNKKKELKYNISINSGEERGCVIGMKELAATAKYFDGRGKKPWLGKKSASNSVLKIRIN